MLETLITSKTRVKLLLKFFLNTATESYLRNLATEFGESSNAIRVELNRLEYAGLLESKTQGNKKLYQANKVHPLYEDLGRIVHKYVGIDKIIENIAKRLGNLDQVYITGDLVRGIDSGIINLLLIGENLDREYLARLSQKAEEMIGKKISSVCFSHIDFKTFQTEHSQNIFLIWSKK